MRSLISSIAKIPKIVNFFGVRTLTSDSVGKLTLLDVNDKTGLAVLTLNRPPVNALNLEMLTEISNVLSEIEENHSRGLIITSSSNKVFSAGLDILEMYKPDPERVKLFWRTLQDVWLKLYGSGYPTAAAINGHSPAGGCLLALCSDYRVMLPKFTIGLNETKVGIVVPKWLIATMKNVLPTRIAESAVVAGTLFTTDEALKVGLIDEIATDKTEAIAKCEQFMTKFAKISPVARSLTKQSFRIKYIHDLEESREKEVKEFVSFIIQPKVQKDFQVTLENLKTKSKKC